MDAARAGQVMEALRGLYPEAKPELHFANPYETLIATILSAQCTDKRVNLVTERLFPLYPDAFAMAKLTPEALEPMIRECGLYHNKAKNIVAASRALVEQYGGQVPNTREALMKLPGVGQKTAGVVLLAAFGDDQIPVDTGASAWPTPTPPRRWSGSCGRCWIRTSGPWATTSSSGTAAAAVTPGSRSASGAR